MEIEGSICSLELAKKLKVLKVNQDSIWWWYQIKRLTNSNFGYADYFQKDIPFELHLGQRSTLSTGKDTFEEYSAFTVAELGVFLPQGFYSGKTATGYTVYLAPEWEHKFCLNNRDLWNISKSEKEADARAKIAIWLLENTIPKEGE